MKSMKDMKFFFLMGIEVKMEKYYWKDNKKIKLNKVWIYKI